MALTTDPSGAAAPAGGFKQGGWYSGYRLLNGAFLPKGQDTPGNTVSPEVNAQSAKAQGVTPANFDAYLQKPAAPSTQSPTTNTPTTPTNVQAYLDNYQAGAQSVVGNIPDQTNKTDEQIMAEVKSQLTPTTPMPTPPNEVATYQGYLASMGVNTLNAQAASLKSQIATIQSSLEGQQATEQGTGGTVPLNVIAGRQTEEARQAQVKLDSLNLQLGVVTDQINTTMNSISTIMTLTQQDYTNAQAAWQAEFDVNSKIYDAFTTAKQNQTSLQLEQQKAAATNFQTMANLITSGNINLNNLSPDQQAQITSLEVQAGLPVGTLSNLQMSPKDKLLYTSQYRGQVQAIVQNSDGSMSFQTFGSVQSGGTVAEQKQQYSDSAMQDAQSGVTLSDLLNIYNGYLTPNEIYDIYNQSNYYGTATESPAQLRAWGITQVPYSATQ